MTDPLFLSDPLFVTESDVVEEVEVVEKVEPAKREEEPPKLCGNFLNTKVYGTVLLLHKPPPSAMDTFAVGDTSATDQVVVGKDPPKQQYANFFDAFGSNAETAKQKDQPKQQ